MRDLCNTAWDRAFKISKLICNARNSVTRIFAVFLVFMQLIIFTINTIIFTIMQNNMVQKTDGIRSKKKVRTYLNVIYIKLKIILHICM